MIVGDGLGHLLKRKKRPLCVFSHHITSKGMAYRIMPTNLTSQKMLNASFRFDLTPRKALAMAVHPKDKTHSTNPRGIQAAMAEAIEFAAQDAQALTLAGEAMVQRWRNALAEAQKQQAVAWRYRYNGQWYLSQSKSFALNGFDLAPLFAEPIPRWDGWRSIDTAPEDQHVILCTSGGHVGEAIMLIDEDTGKQKWAWALGPLHPNHMPFGWQPLPDALNAPVASDLRPGGFDGPTGAE